MNRDQIVKGRTFVGSKKIEMIRHDTTFFEKSLFGQKKREKENKQQKLVQENVKGREGDGLARQMQSVPFVAGR